MVANLTLVDDHIRERTPESMELLLPLAAQLFRQAEETLLESFHTDDLFAMARASLQFLDRAGPNLARGAAQVELLDPELERDGWASKSMLLRLALGDRPFIVETVRSELRRQGVAVHHVLHPTLAVTRGPAGQLLSIAERRAPLPEGAVGEALELWFLEHEEDTEQRAALLAGIQRVLSDLILATDDFAAMQQRTRVIAAELRQRSAQLTAAGDAQGAEELAEDAALMTWLEDDHFIFLGYRAYARLDRDEGQVLAIPSSSLGVLRQPAGVAEPILQPTAPWLGERPLMVIKTDVESTVRRAVRMEQVGIARFDERGQVIGEHRLLGLLNTRAYSEPAAEVPIVRMRLRQVLEADGAIPGSHDYKQIVLIFDSLPRVDLFSADARLLQREIRAIMALEQERGVRLLLRPDPLSRGLSVTVRLPRDRFHAEVRSRIQHHLLDRLAARAVDYQLSLGEDEAYARLHFFFTTDIRIGDVDQKMLEHEIAELTRNWHDRLQGVLAKHHGERAGKRLSLRYQTTFDARYQADIDAFGAAAEIERLERYAQRRQTEGPQAVLVDLSAVPGRTVSHLRMFHGNSGLVLSDLLPILEDLGFRVLEQAAYQLRVAGESVTLDLYSVQDHTGSALDVAAQRERLIEAAESILRGESEHDRLSRLVLSGGLRVREVALLRALQMYTVQLNAVTSRRFVHDTLVAHPRSARAIVALFAARFEPAHETTPSAARAAAEEAAFEAFLETLAEVTSLPEDTVLRNLADLVRAMVRCDYYRGAPTIAFKIESARVASMPSPRPLFEIGVASPTVEGVHLRGGRVARGGIRWSDRPDDFRTEVLGLMKTQMTKNVVIVPVGSKGGFVVKGAPSEREALRAHVEAQYRVYVGALLGLTDNLVGGALVPPEGLVIYDEPDPYLVVAADKGTATFSDTANAVAAEHGYWLGDAFASGGSVGYDHKAWGITARGAWAAITRHFRDLNLDPLVDPFSVVGIGDMSGDVFGNGLRYSPSMRLLAAFDHRHIFLDPNPDPLRSLAERERLFALPRSSWADYDASLISEGGGVYPRGAKRIVLSAAAQRALGIGRESLSGAELVQAVLRAPVDLLWNGGIGTYVKASSERHSEVGDAANDSVRVDASELRARIVGEGGNLGFSQRARIEFARAGGRIHTDAIDNSGGVDLSDHEVNLKLALQPLVAAGRLTAPERDALLRTMASEVCDLVLRNNANQALALALAERRSRADVMLFDSLIAYLADQGTLDPAVEQLPNRRAILERARLGEGLTRPELAIVMAYMKMGVYRRLLDSELPDEPYFTPGYLQAYFPSALVARFPEAMHSHPLRREIIATLMTGRVVDLLGMTFIHRAIRDTGATTLEVVRAALIALEVLDVAGFERKLAAAAGHVTGKAELDALERLVAAVEGVVRLMLLNDLSGVDIASFVRAYQEPLAAVRESLAELLPVPERRRHARAAKRHHQEGLTSALAHDVATLAYLPSAMAVVEVAHATGTPLEVVGRLFFAIGERLRLGWLRDELRELTAEDTWSKIAINGLVMDLRQVQRDFTERYVRARREQPRLALDAFLAQTPNVIKRYDAALARIVADEALSLASAGVVVRLLAQAR